jgi:hypothetical protein
MNGEEDLTTRTVTLQFSWRILTFKSVKDAEKKEEDRHVLLILQLPGQINNPTVE